MSSDSCKRRRASSLILLLLAVPLLLAATPAVASPGPCHTADCTERDVKVLPTGVAGAAIVVADGHGGVRKIAGGGDCPGCAWKIIPECALHGSSAGRVVEPNACNNATSGFRCTLANGKPGLPYREFFSSSGTAGPWQPRGTPCLGPTDRPVSTDALFAQVRTYVDRLIPAAPQVAMQPPGTTLVNLVTLFQAGQATDPGNRAAGKVFFANAGAPVAMNIAVRPQQWAWNIDGQAGAVVRDYCCREYTSDHSPRAEPDYYASHTFDTTGPHTATVTVTWLATATINGLGAVPVDGTFNRTSPAYVFQVKQARAQLESGQ